MTRAHSPPMVERSPDPDPRDAPGYDPAACRARPCRGTECAVCYGTGFARCDRCGETTEDGRTIDADGVVRCVECASDRRVA